MLAIRLLFAFAFFTLLLPSRSPQAAMAVAERGLAETAAERIVEGRVARFQSRLSPHGHPVTDVVLEPGGEIFTLLGGYHGGVLWRAEEEAQLALGELVRVRLEPGPSGWRPSGGPLGVERLEAETFTRQSDGGGIEQYRFPPRVISVTPPSGPAVAHGFLVVEVRGSHFGYTQGSSQVFFQGLFEHVPASVIEWTDDRIRCFVPQPGVYGSPQVFSGPVKVWTAHGGWSEGQEWLGGARYEVEFQFAGDYWDPDRLPIEFFVNPRGFPWPVELVREQMRRAALTWSELPFSFCRFDFRGEVDLPPGREIDGMNVVSWTSPWPYPTGWIAVTWSAIDSTTGARLENDVEINGEQPWSVSERPPNDSYDFLSTLIHELGHWFRLGHVSDPSHVMHLFQSKGDARRTLGRGDRRGASWVYPAFGRARASADSVFFGGEHPEALIVEVQVTDRQGRIAAGLPANQVFAVAEAVNDGPTPTLSTGGVEGVNGWLLAESETDGEGRTRIVISDTRGEGWVRLRVFGGGGLLRDSPEIFVSERGRCPSSRFLALRPPYPNPSLGQPPTASVRLAAAVPRLLARVIDARGRVVRVLYDAPAPAGELELTVDIRSGSTSLAPGLYFLDVRAENSRETKKFILLGG
jgi:hypothetical protein